MGYDPDALVILRQLTRIGDSAEKRFQTRKPREVDIFDYCSGLWYSITIPLLLFKITWALRHSLILVPTLVCGLIAIVLTSSSPPEQLGELLKKKC